LQLVDIHLYGDCLSIPVYQFQKTKQILITKILNIMKKALILLVVIGLSIVGLSSSNPLTGQTTGTGTIVLDPVEIVCPPKDAGEIPWMGACAIADSDRTCFPTGRMSDYC
jgi:hypothetical protein